MRFLWPFVLLAACRTTPVKEAAPRPGHGPVLQKEGRPLGHAGRRREGKKEAIEEYLEEYGYDEEDFEARPDRWRIGMPDWDRTPIPSLRMRNTDSPYMRGRRANPYRQNVLKGEYPVIGQNTFFIFTALSDTVFEYRDTPTPASISTRDPKRPGFFGSGDQFFIQTNLLLSFELLHGNAAFKPPEWVLRITPVFNLTHLDTDENNAVNIDVRKGVTRDDGHIGLQEAFFEKHIVDLSANYDFLSVTAGIQQFISDFRGFVFFDNNLGLRATMNLDNNRTQINVAAFYQLEKDTNSELNGYEFREQFVLIANYFRQDFLWFGYTFQASIHWNHDQGPSRFDENGVPVRPPVIGDADNHKLDIVYLGFAGDGHIGRVNVTHEFFWALGEDTDNPVAGRPVDVNAQMAFLELSVDFDWWRPRLSFLWASGDDDPTDGTARGFDSILDNPNFAGGLNSYWIRQNVRLSGVALVQRLSPFPTLRSSKIEGQSNFVNPGILFLTAGIDAEVTAELRASINFSYLRFSEVGTLEPFLNQNDVDPEIGYEFNIGAIYRPYLTNNIQFAGGLGVFLPGAGFKDIYESGSTLISAFFQMTFTY